MVARQGANINSDNKNTIIDKGFRLDSWDAYDSRESFDSKTLEFYFFLMLKVTSC